MQETHNYIPVGNPDGIDQQHPASGHLNIHHLNQHLTTARIKLRTPYMELAPP